MLSTILAQDFSEEMTPQAMKYKRILKWIWKANRASGGEEYDDVMSGADDGVVGDRVEQDREDPFDLVDRENRGVDGKYVLMTRDVDALGVDDEELESLLMGMNLDELEIFLSAIKLKILSMFVGELVEQLPSHLLEREIVQSVEKMGDVATAVYVLGVNVLAAKGYLAMTVVVGDNFEGANAGPRRNAKDSVGLASAATRHAVWVNAGLVNELAKNAGEAIEEATDVEYMDCVGGTMAFRAQFGEEMCAEANVVEVTEVKMTEGVNVGGEMANVQRAAKKSEIVQGVGEMKECELKGEYWTVGDEEKRGDDAGNCDCQNDAAGIAVSTGGEQSTLKELAVVVTVGEIVGEQK